MKKFAVITGLLISTVVAAGPAEADQYVRGYYRSNGTYVQPHYRSSPNGNAFDNWSTRGNVNPYTGTRGTRDPYSSYSSPSNSSPSYSSPSYSSPSYSSPSYSYPRYRY